MGAATWVRARSPRLRQPEAGRSKARVQTTGAALLSRPSPVPANPASPAASETPSFEQASSTAAFSASSALAMKRISRRSVLATVVPKNKYTGRPDLVPPRASRVVPFAQAGLAGPRGPRTPGPVWRRLLDRHHALRAVHAQHRAVRDHLRGNSGADHTGDRVFAGANRGVREDAASIGHNGSRDGEQ
jgi:hypothetical protein